MTRPISTNGRLGSGFTVWLTGLPCSGKTTLAKLLEKHLERCGHRTVVFDGDEVRDRLSKGLGFSKEDRIENIRRISYVCRLVTQLDGVAIAAAISPHRSARKEARREIGNLVEVYVKCSIEKCIKRDVKGHYQKALQGKIQNFTGVSDPYEEPLKPDIVVDTERQTPEESLDSILEGLKGMGCIQDA